MRGIILLHLSTSFHGSCFGFFLLAKLPQKPQRPHLILKAQDASSSSSSPIVSSAKKDSSSLLPYYYLLELSQKHSPKKNQQIFLFVSQRSEKQKTLLALSYSLCFLPSYSYTSIL
ncbi:hypothetical protein Droror1_Dr00008750 [Drosera rotundifolia]